MTSSFNIQGTQLEFMQTKLTLKLLTQSGSQSLNAIETAIEDMTGNDILVTLPTSKDQFGGHAGHTEYFRQKFSQPDLPMSFISEQMNVSLLTDHIPLSLVSKSITFEGIIQKVETLLTSFSKYKNIKRILFSGINPHNGENGLLGIEDKLITEAIEELSGKHSNIKFLGPYPGDTLVFNHFNSSDLIIFASHDQGLGIFKQQSGIMGINITFGMPFLRISPDHGTAFHLYGKNKANYFGMVYLLNMFNS